MNPLFFVLYQILNIVWFVIVAHFVMSWLISFSVLNLHQPIVAQVWDALNRLTDPIYRPIRKYMPDMGGLDLSPLVALLIVIGLQYTITYYG